MIPEFSFFNPILVRLHRGPELLLIAQLSRNQMLSFEILTDDNIKMKI